MQPSPELKELSLGVYDAFAQGDVQFFTNRFSHQPGMLAIGTDPKEWWRGYETFVKMIEAQSQEMGQMSFTDCDPEAYQEGTVGWSADRPIIHLPGGIQVPIRITQVFHQEDGRWQVVQVHMSVGVDNEEVVGKDLTTE